MLIVQMSDLHVTAAGTRAAGGLVDTNEALARAVLHVNRLDPQPDLVLLTGDLVNGPAPGEYDELARLLRPLRAPVLALPGNHDDRAAMRAAFPGQFARPHGPWLLTEHDAGPLRLLLLDSQVPGEDHGVLCEGRLGWLADRLAAAPGRPTLVAVHHPPFASGLQAMDGMRLQGARPLAALLASHASVVGVVCGHLHRLVAVPFAGRMAFCCPSTAHQIALDLRPGQPPRWTREPAAVALHLWDADCGLRSHLSPIGDHPVHDFPGG
jgi:3',5'-cyclic AMP phosphodiesterase CpdA